MFQIRALQAAPIHPRQQHYLQRLLRLGQIRRNWFVIRICLAAQSMITNVAGLASFKGRVGELQEILRKVANETITYEDFVKWHDLSMKTAIPPKPHSEQKPVVNGAVKPSTSTSSLTKSTAHVNNTEKETPAAPVALPTKTPTTTSAAPVKRTTLAQAMAASSAPTRARPLTLTSAQIAERFERDKQDTIRGLFGNLFYFNL
ncbi:unnamed protein product [Strongylus vulgaris]|uniref:Uncharacterized protein n=1 Tax=Strongylus vulgaris TaxID=40348 RepID=A0A3P7L1S6_STRVU|nr:unnamed protein product [Strongylus vulgaris]